MIVGICDYLMYAGKRVTGLNRYPVTTGVPASEEAYVMTEESWLMDGNRPGLNKGENSGGK